MKSERINEVKNIHKEMIIECKGLYLDDINNLIETESKTKQSYNELKSKLNEIIYFPEFPQMDCKWVKIG